MAVRLHDKTTLLGVITLLGLGLYLGILAATFLQDGPSLLAKNSEENRPAVIDADNATLATFDQPQRY